MDKNCKSEKYKIMSAQYWQQVLERMWTRKPFLTLIGLIIASCSTGLTTELEEMGHSILVNCSQFTISQVR